jgi:hypothetical protein
MTFVRISARLDLCLNWKGVHFLIGMRDGFQHGRQERANHNPSLKEGRKEHFDLNFHLSHWV